MSIELAAFTTLALRREGPVLHVTLNRPEVRNAMSLTMVRELRAVLAQAEADGQTRVLVLRGAGGHFCAGGDIKDMAGARAKLAENPNALAETNAAFGELCVAYAHTPLALVTVLRGTVMGGGFGLACVSDVALADDTVVFRLPETSLGLVPAQVGPFLVERIGYAETKRLAVTGAKIDAAEALRLRLVHEVHIEDEALEWALARVVKGILACAPGALAATKKLLAQARFTPPAALVPEAARVFSAAVLGPEGVEGTLAFVGKRKPAWVPEEAPTGGASAS
ncbi:MAG: enoyl-CoA hydratase/isomerase family protein [Rubrivivax sp.]|nr:enoyl-CoA hydratase/isomerase family protein [Rubrivivax sp.]MCL4697261.1 enoyl-CoA hydratase/isomerase family protein [Burkholderiaceae bacterium]